jgi:hypothetical protein
LDEQGPAGATVAGPAAFQLTQFVRIGNIDVLHRLAATTDVD